VSTFYLLELYKRRLL